MKRVTFSARHAVAWGLGALMVAQLLAWGRSWQQLRALSPALAAASIRHGRVPMSTSTLATRIIGAHLFGGAPRAPAAADEATANDNRYSLKGIVAIGSSGQGFAIIAGANGRSKLYQTGQSLAARVVLRRVTSQYVVLLNNSRLERLALPQASLATLLVAAVRRRTAAPTPGESIVSLSDDTRATLQTFSLNVIADAAGGIGGLSGQGSPSWHRSGLLPSDVIVAIDGTPVGEVLNTPLGIDHASMAAATTLTVLRDGAQMDIEAVPEPAHMVRRPRPKS
jgi:type II secretory pathway component PulC